MKILLICLAVLSVLILFLLFIRLNFYFEGYFNNESKNFMLRFYVFTKKLGFNIFNKFFQ